MSAPRFSYVGMPAELYLKQFGAYILDAFGHPAYLVGSALTSKTFRDVDVRLILPDATHKALELGHPSNPHQNRRWVSLCLAYSAFGKTLTGLPIDFQIHQQSWANEHYEERRIALATFAP